MRASLRALLPGVIDYAGLFPPAKLPLDEAFRNYVRYTTTPESWLLGRFVVPAARLLELDIPSHPTPLAFSVLGRGGDTAEDYAAGVRADLEAIAAFRARWSGRVVVDAFEVKLPPAALGERGITKQLATHGLSVVYEVPLAADWEAELRLLAGGAAGVKLRTGGLEAAAFPSPLQVATVIELCRWHRLPLKCTAGLHHPLRRYDAGVGTHMHGFLNVMLACVLAYTHGLVRHELERLLKCETLEGMAFTAEGVRVDGHQVGVEQLAAARQEAFLSFGSCSFDEPCDDLRELGLLGSA